MLLTGEKVVLFSCQKYLRGAHHGRIGDHESEDLSRLRLAVVVREVWLLPPVPPDFELLAGVAVRPRGGGPTLPSQAVNLI